MRLGRAGTNLDADCFAQTLYMRVDTPRKLPALRVRRKGTSLLNVNRGDGVTTASRKTQDTKFCRKKADTAKIVTERKADISETDSKDKINFYFKAGLDPNTETLELENVNLLVDYPDY